MAQDIKNCQVELSFLTHTCVYKQRKDVSCSFICILLTIPCKLFYAILCKYNVCLDVDAEQNRPLVIKGRICK